MLSSASSPPYRFSSLSQLPRIPSLYLFSSHALHRRVVLPSSTPFFIPTLHSHHPPLLSYPATHSIPFPTLISRSLSFANRKASAIPSQPSTPLSQPHFFLPKTSLQPTHCPQGRPSLEHWSDMLRVVCMGLCGLQTSQVFSHVHYPSLPRVKVVVLSRPLHRSCRPVCSFIPCKHLPNHSFIHLLLAFPLYSDIHTHSSACPFVQALVSTQKHIQPLRFSTHLMKSSSTRAEFHTHWYIFCCYSLLKGDSFPT